MWLCDAESLWLDFALEARSWLESPKVAKSQNNPARDKKRENKVYSDIRNGSV
jgi:hypothetical protein